MKLAASVIFLALVAGCARGPTKRHVAVGVFVAVGVGLIVYLSAIAISGVGASKPEPR